MKKKWYSFCCKFLIVTRLYKIKSKIWWLKQKYYSGGILEVIKYLKDKAIDYFITNGLVISFIAMIVGLVIIIVILAL